MANISTSIELYDKVSAPILKMMENLHSLTGSFDTVDAAMNDAFDVSNLSNARDEIDQIANETNHVGNEIDENIYKQDRFNKELQEGESNAGGLLQKLMGFAGAFGGLMVLKQQAMQAIDYASDLTEVQNVVDVAFGQSAAVVNEWSKTTLDAYGLNELSAKRYAGTMGAMLKSSGLAGDAVVDMSMKIAELSGDMASFYNLDGEEAFNKIRSGISGETEPLKQLGINMSVANLEAYALAQGIEKAYDEMSQAEQVMLRFNYLMSVSQDAQGDFTRTSGSFANQTKLLKENWQAFTGELATSVLPILSATIGMLNGALGFLADNWSILSPILWGVAAALAIVNAPLLAQAGLWLWNTVLVPAYTFVLGLLKVGYGVLTGSTAAASAAQLIYNNALLACPITWILLIIIAIVAALYAVVAAINKVMGTTISATGIICGALMVALAFIGNLFIALINSAIDYFVAFWNFIGSFANFLVNVFTDPVGSIARLFFDMVDSVLGLLESLASAIDTIFGSDLASSVSGWRDGLDEWVDEKFGKGEEVFKKIDPNTYHLDRFDYSDAYDSGYKFGEGVDESVANMFGGGMDGLSDLVDPNSMIPEGYDSSMIPSNIADTAANTDSMADSMDITSEDLKYLRDLAETEIINRFTTAEIKIEMTNNNNVSSDMDLDGMIDYLANGVNDAMTKAAEGVHS